MKRMLLSGVICLLGAFPLSAQNTWNHFTAKMGAGISMPVGQTSDHADAVGFNFVAAAGPRFNSKLALLFDFSLNAMNIKLFNNNEIITRFDADMYLWNLTLNPSYEYVRKDKFALYATGGYGLYNRRLNLTQTEVVGVVECDDDFWGICENGFIPVQSVTPLAGRSTYKGGFNVGSGVTFGTRVKYFVEFRYHHMFTTNHATEAIPITLGVRW